MNFFATNSETGIPPEPCLDQVHVNLDGILYTNTSLCITSGGLQIQAKGKGV
jgi:hypothetical protein